ncbi:MAG TPA: calcium/sodium antiporter [Burkholderiaceae bacterium]|nr:calcium/sodium antiporter [Burkholderiaceae bacterium]
MSPYLTLALGVLSAGLGGELFVRGTVSLATWARIAPGIVGATVAAFATSSPELSVSITSALAGTPQIALGDALGSNVVNIALILAMALLISGIQSSRDSIRRDFPVAFLVPVLTAALAADGELSRLDGVLMLSIFLAWMIATVIEARRQRSAAEEVLGAHRLAPALVSAAIGLALLVGAGLLIVDGARAIATSFGLSEFIIGATVVAVGTSVPELATALISKLRGHDEVGLGTVLGSNIFNGLFIVAVAALIHPIAFEASSVRVALAFGLVAVMLTLPGKSGYIGRGRGLLLLLLYVAYVVAVVRG